MPSTVLRDPCKSLSLLLIRYYPTMKCKMFLSPSMLLILYPMELILMYQHLLYPSMEVLHLADIQLYRFSHLNTQAIQLLPSGAHNLH